MSCMWVATMLSQARRSFGVSQRTSFSFQLVSPSLVTWKMDPSTSSPATAPMAAPMTHAAGPICFPVFARGGTIVIHDGVNPQALLESIQRHRVTRMFLPPTAIYSLLAQVNAGSVYWNCCDRVSPRLPWSGFGDSGIGVMPVSAVGTVQQVWTLDGRMLAEVAKRPLRTTDDDDDDPAAVAARAPVTKALGDIDIRPTPLIETLLLRLCRTGQADDGVEPARAGEGLGRDGELERAGHAYDLDVVVRHAEVVDPHHVGMIEARNELVLPQETVKDLAGGRVGQLVQDLQHQLRLAIWRGRFWRRMFGSRSP